MRDKQAKDSDAREQRGKETKGGSGKATQVTNEKASRQDKLLLAVLIVAALAVIAGILLVACP